MIRIILALGVCTFGVGCGGHVLMRGTLVTSTSPSEGQICMHDGEVAVGDAVRVVHHTCDVNPAANAASRQCVASAGGTATVTELLNEHYAIVQAAPGTELRAGDTIEPMND